MKNNFFKIKYKFFINYRKHNEFWLPKYSQRKIMTKYLQKSHWSVYNILNIINIAFNLQISEKSNIYNNLLFIHTYLELIGKIDDNKVYELNKCDFDDKKITNKKFIINNNKKKSMQKLNIMVCLIIKRLSNDCPNNNLNTEVKELIYYLLWFVILFTDYCLSKIKYQNLFFVKNNISNSYLQLNYCIEKYTEILQNKWPKNFNYLVQSINKVFYYNI